jgi:hypothetical protein
MAGSSDDADAAARRLYRAVAKGRSAAEVRAAIEVCAPRARHAQQRRRPRALLGCGRQPR